MRSLEVVDVTPLTEVTLGVIQASESSIRQDLGNHRAVEALILAVGLRMCGAAVAESDTKTYQPHAQSADHADASRPPRSAVVGIDTLGQAVALEGSLQHALHRLVPLVGFAHGKYPVATDLVDRGLALPAYATMDDATQDRVVAAVREVLA